VRKPTDLKAQLEFRAGFYNAFNHPILAMHLSLFECIWANIERLNRTSHLVVCSGIMPARITLIDCDDRYDAWPPKRAVE
jgi:hypothetical protein